LNGHAAGRDQAEGIQRLLRAAALPLSGARRAAGLVRARWLFRACKIGDRVFAGSKVVVRADGTIALGDGVQFWIGTLPQELVSERGATLVVGPDTMFNYAVSVRATERVAIGARCMFGSHVCIGDAKGRPVEIGDDVWVAHGAIVEPGVRIGRASVISAGSVVTQDVPELSLAVGNPARAVPIEVPT
jgi:maltose O-acetyltransferase